MTKASSARRALFSGFDLPLEATNFDGRRRDRGLWLSVDQWLITCPRAEAAALQARLTQALAGVHSLAVDMSDARAIFRLEGENAREVLNKGTSARFHLARDRVPASSGASAMRRSPRSCMCRSTSPFACDLYVFRSYADYAWNFLTFTAREAARVALFKRQS